MKVISDVLTWITAIALMLYCIIFGIMLLSAAVSFNGVESNVLRWIGLFLMFLWIPSMLITILRQIRMDKYNKVKYGVLTLLFVSIPGGILTLCLQDIHLNKPIPLPTIKDKYKYLNKLEEERNPQKEFSIGDNVEIFIDDLKSITGSTIEKGTKGIVTSIDGHELTVVFDLEGSKRVLKSNDYNFKKVK